MEDSCHLVAWKARFRAAQHLCLPVGQRARPGLDGRGDQLGIENALPCGHPSDRVRKLGGWGIFEQEPLDLDSQCAQQVTRLAQGGALRRRSSSGPITTERPVG